jgi:hypothetical protein
LNQSLVCSVEIMVKLLRFGKHSSNVLLTIFRNAELRRKLHRNGRALLVEAVDFSGSLAGSRIGDGKSHRRFE